MSLCDTCRYAEAPANHPNCIECTRRGLNVGWEPYGHADFQPLDALTEEGGAQ